jgi:hypothetical protein
VDAGSVEIGTTISLSIDMDVAVLFNKPLAKL